MRCNKCGQDLNRLMILALLQEFGARCSSGADKCTADGGEHDFRDMRDPSHAKEAPDAKS